MALSLQRSYDYFYHLPGASEYTDMLWHCYLHHDYTKRPRSPITEQERMAIRARYRQRQAERELGWYKDSIRKLYPIELKLKKQRTIVFSVNYQTTFGKNLYVVGSTDKFGNWDPEKAVPMQWNPDHYWRCRINASTDDEPVEYKFIIKEGNRIQWEPGENHKLNASGLQNKFNFLEKFWGDGS